MRVLRFEVPVAPRVHEVVVPPGGEVVHVATRDPAVVEVWVSVPDSTGPGVTRGFLVVATGQPWPDVPPTHHFVYVGTAVTSRGALVWHLLEVVPGSW